MMLKSVSLILILSLGFSSADEPKEQPGPPPGFENFGNFANIFQQWLTQFNQNNPLMQQQNQQNIFQWPASLKQDDFWKSFQAFFKLPDLASLNNGPDNGPDDGPDDGSDDENKTAPVQQQQQQQQQATNNNQQQQQQQQQQNTNKKPNQSAQQQQQQQQQAKP